jgi:hypothetical protein
MADGAIVAALLAVVFNICSLSREVVRHNDDKIYSRSASRIAPACPLDFIGRLACGRSMGCIDARPFELRIWRDGMARLKSHAQAESARL